MDNEELPQRTREDFLQKTLDCLRSHIAVLNEDGTIIAVNATWNRFAVSNGLAEQFCGRGANYLRSCDQAIGTCSDEAASMSDGIRDVIAKRQEHFYLEYPCHSPTEQRWFGVRVTRFEIGGLPRIVVAHDSITQRKLAEFKLQDANRQLELLAATDVLTGVANRRSFDRTMEQEWKRHARTGSPISLAILDVDCFKQFNDTQGHLAGDDCLRLVAEAVRSTLQRPGDFVARYGGEEFAVILPNTDSAGATTVLQTVLLNIRKLAISHPSSKVSRGIVTVSIGGASAVPDKSDSPSQVLRRADQALYEAKRGGRDQLICFEQHEAALG